MNRKHIFFVLCAVFAICAMTFAFTACSNQATEEVFGDWETVTSPTCEDVGYEMRVSLNDPNVTETRAIPAKGHDWNEWTVKTAPTCLVAGVETRTCNTCENLDMRAIPVLGHDWGSWNSLVDATCDTKGSQVRTCLRDGSHTEYRSVDALGHDFSEWVITRTPSCTVGGLETRYCRNCNNHTELRAVEPLGHNWSEYVCTKAPTCTEKGEETRFCTNDVAHIEKRITFALGHSYGDWVRIKEPTESENGEEIRVCVRDASHIETRADVPALGSLDKLKFTLKNNNEYEVAASDNKTFSGTVYIPSTYNGLPVTEIAWHGFHSCREMESIVFLGNNLRKIKSIAFASCAKLQSVEFPEGVEVIEHDIFALCSNLKSVSFPSTVISIGAKEYDASARARNMMFIRCTALESITVAEGNPVYKAEDNCLIERKSNTLMWGAKNSVIPNYVKVIGACAFSEIQIESVRIPASVEEIHSRAFEGCDKLTNLTFENGALTELNAQSFMECTGLERVELPDNLLTLSLAFWECTSLKEVVFGSKIETIGNKAFIYCTNITTCEIPASVKSIATNAFAPVVYKNITVSEDNPYYIEDGNCIIEVETKMLLMGRNNAVIPEYVTAIGANAFKDCEIDSIVIPSGVTSIGEYAFSGCKSLTEIELPAQLEKIGQGAFLRCPISTLVIPATVTEIGTLAFSNANLTSVTVEEGNTAYKVESGCLVELATGKLILAFGDNAVIPDWVKVIGEYAFSFCTNENIVIPASVENAEAYAFYNLTGLEPYSQTLVFEGFSSRKEVDDAWSVGWYYGVGFNYIFKEQI